MATQDINTNEDYNGLHFGAHGEKRVKPKYDLSSLLDSLKYIKLNNNGDVLNPQADIDDIIKIAKYLQIRLGCMVAGMSITLFYYQDETPEEDRYCGLHWITHSIGVYIQDLGRLINMLSNKSGLKWPINLDNKYTAGIDGVLFSLPFLNEQPHISDKSIISSGISFLSKSAFSVVDAESTHLRLFSEAFMNALPTREIDSGADGALAYISEWSGLIEWLFLAKDTADYAINNMKVAA